MADITEAIGTDLAHVGGDNVIAPNGDLGRIAGLANLKNRLWHRLITVPGTLVHRPLYGVGITLYANGLSSFGLQQKLAGDIQEQFAQDPAVEDVASVSIVPDNINPQMTMIKISVKPFGYTETQMTFTPFSGGA